MPDSRPIGVFDSGVGGLTVLQAVHGLLPLESTVYLGDLARCPYGTRPAEEVRQFAQQAADYLARQDIKLLVVACNTATAAAIDMLQETCAFPVVGVIEPGALAAVRLSHAGRIGVVATDATVASGAYRRAITAKRPNAVVLERPLSWLVPLIELGLVGERQVQQRLSPDLAFMRRAGIDVLVLGCTHFPLLAEVFEAEAGPDVAVIDSACTTVHEVGRLLDALDLRSDAAPGHRLLVTGPALAFTERARSMFMTAPAIGTVTLSADAAV